MQKVTAEYVNPGPGCELTGKTAIVTGSTSGIGLGIARAFAEAGMHVMLNGFGDNAEIERTRMELEESCHIKTAYSAADMSKPEDIVGMVEDARRLFGKVDVLVNNAGIQLYDDLSGTAALEQQLAVNLYGPLAVTNAFLAQLVESQGTIVNNVSMEALAPVPVHPSYAISKAAAFNMTQSLRALLTPKGVRVHAMLAGPTDTEMMRGLEAPKATPQSVAEGIFDGVERGDEEIFPDPMSIKLADSWRTGPVKEFEHQFAAFVNPLPVAS